MDEVNLANDHVNPIAVRMNAKKPLVGFLSVGQNDWGHQGMIIV